MTYKEAFVHGFAQGDLNAAIFAAALMIVFSFIPIFMVFSSVTILALENLSRKEEFKKFRYACDRVVDVVTHGDIDLPGEG